MSNIGLSTDLVLANTSVRPGTLVLPLSTQIPGRTITIKCATGSCAVSTCYISTSGGDTFEDGSTTQALTTSYGFIKVTARAGKWYTGATTQPNMLTANTINAATTQATAISTGNMTVNSLSLGSNTLSVSSSSLAYWGPYLLNSGFLTAQPQIFFAIAKLMSQVYTLSTYSLANITNNVSPSTSTPAYIWTVSIPSGAKGKNAILTLFFNLYSSGTFATSQSFDYGIYIDGVGQLKGDVATIHYVQSATGNYAMSSGGIVMGLNGMVSAYPILIPLSISAGASQIQIGIANSSAQMTSLASSTPGYSSNVLTASGSGGTLVPQNTFTTAGSNIYTVPSNTSVGVPVGVYIYCWGAGGQAQNSIGGPGGFVSGFYAAGPGTNLLYVVGRAGQSSSAPLLSYGGGGQASAGGGGFSGIFLSNAGGIVQSNAIAVAGGGGGGGQVNATTGGYGGYPSGGAQFLVGSSSQSTTTTGGTQTAGGVGVASSNAGSALTGGPGTGYGAGAGGGWFGGAGGNDGATYVAGAGGAGYIGNVNGASGGIGMTNATYANGSSAITGYTTPGNTVAPGGSNNTYYTGSYGQNAQSGLVVIVPAVGTAATQVGVSATLFSA